MKKIRYFFEATLLYLLFGFFKCLPAKTASNIGGWIGRTIGHKLAASRKARKNTELAFPNITQDEQDKIIIGMWDNLGRIIAEYPHLEQIGREFTTFENEQYLASHLNSDKPLVFFGGHIGNWEVNSVALVTHFNKPVNITYRAPNNPWVATLLNKTRTRGNNITAFPKSREGGRKIMQSMKDGGSLGILIDQKYNEGIDVPFFGLSAMTNPIFVQLCQKYKCPLIPQRCVRLSGCSFRICIYPPLELFESDKTTPRPVIDVIKDAHSIMEGWIREKPEQWLWLHRRWKL